MNNLSCLTARPRLGRSGYADALRHAQDRPFDRLRERLGLAVRSFPANRWLSLSKPALGPSLEARGSEEVDGYSLFAAQKPVEQSGMPEGDCEGKSLGWFKTKVFRVPGGAIPPPSDAVAEESGRWEYAGVREVIHPASRDGRSNWSAGRNLQA